MVSDLPGMSNMLHCPAAAHDWMKFYVIIWLGCDVLPPVEAAEQFSNILGDLLLEYGLTKPSHIGDH